MFAILINRKQKKKHKVKSEDMKNLDLNRLSCKSQIKSLLLTENNH